MEITRHTWYWFEDSGYGPGILRKDPEGLVAEVYLKDKGRIELKGFAFVCDLKGIATTEQFFQCTGIDLRRPSDQAGMKLSTGSTGGKARADLSSLIIMGTIVAVLVFCLVVSKIFPKDSDEQLERDALEYKIDSAYQVGYIEGRANAVDAIKAERTDTTVIPCQDGTIND